RASTPPLDSRSLHAALPVWLAPGAAVLVDLPLAGTPNPGFLAALRCDARLVDVPILALVDEEDDATVRDAMGAGADDFVRASLLDRKSTRLNSSHVKISYAV